MVMMGGGNIEYMIYKKPCTPLFGILYNISISKNFTKHTACGGFFPLSFFFVFPFFFLSMLGFCSGKRIFPLVGIEGRGLYRFRRGVADWGSLPILPIRRKAEDLQTWSHEGHEHCIKHDPTLPKVFMNIGRSGATEVLLKMKDSGEYDYVKMLEMCHHIMRSNGNEEVGWHHGNIKALGWGFSTLCNRSRVEPVLAGVGPARVVMLASVASYYAYSKQDEALRQRIVEMCTHEVLRRPHEFGIFSLSKLCQAIDNTNLKNAKGFPPLLIRLVRIISREEYLKINHSETDTIESAHTYTLRRFSWWQIPVPELLRYISSVPTAEMSLEFAFRVLFLERRERNGPLAYVGQLKCERERALAHLRNVVHAAKSSTRPVETERGVAAVLEEGVQLMIKALVENTVLVCVECVHFFTTAILRHLDSFTAISTLVDNNVAFLLAKCGRPLDGDSLKRLERGVR